ncbi:MAG TPA: lytic transglycosylase domain-containing protein [Rhizomicrobium sp.]|nr:lytic transglycosylase domain-containing protein [Rhizomicrobium sp.]
MGNFRAIFLAGAAALFAATAALPQTRTAPLASGDGISINTERRAGFVRVLSPADHALFLQAYAATEHDNWSAALALAAQGHDAMARRFIEWRYLLDKDSGAPFDRIAAFLHDYPEWPMRDALYARAEAVMGGNLPAQTVLAFYAGHQPVTPVGKIRLGEAYLATGNPSKGRALIQQAWIAGDFDSAQEYEIVSRHRDILTADIDRARLNRLLLDDETTEARRELPRAPADAQQVAQVRIALRTAPAQGVEMIGRLPASLQNDPGLLFDRIRLMRAWKQVDTIALYLSRMPTRQLAQIDPGKWWSELSADAREAIAERHFQTAHSIIAYSGLTSGDEFSDAQFLAGWLDLRFLRNPREARTHFLLLGKNLDRPISKSRAYYWAGRASEAATESALARADYRYAAQYSQTFYGQLALAKLDPTPVLHVAGTPAPTTAADVAQYESQDLTRAIHVIGDLGLVAHLRTFATYDAETHPEAKHLKLLLTDLANMGFTDAAIRAAKTAAYRGIHLLPYSHPVIGLPGYSGPGYTPEPAFVLALIRQETEFDPAAISGSGARGLMQLMPASAKLDAQRGNLPFWPNRLLSDTSYNMQLGMIELGDNLGYFGGSYLLAVAAYNAGRTNVNRWINTYGDPRSPVVDPVDWIEEIPFVETRNYVQRVLENAEVYRNRLGGRDEPLRILTDLYRPRVPDARPLPAAPPVPSLRSDAGASETVARK